MSDGERAAGRAERGRQWRVIAEIPILLVIALLVAFVLKTFIAQPFVIPSASMEPQLNVGDRVVVSKLSYELHDPHRGDIVVFDSPEPHTTHHDIWPVAFVKDVLEGVGIKRPDDDVLIKRVIALPGETVEGRDGHVYIDGQLLLEPYLPSSLQTEPFPATTVPSGDVWVMGDNRGDSRDSRSFGVVKESSIIGRAIAKVWPPTDISFL
jgi:signal peptidase I